MTVTPFPQSVVHDGPDTIWLEPSCCAGPSNGRTWCEDAAFPECEDGAKPTKYVRADLAAPAPSSLASGEVWAALEPFAKVADTALCPSDEPDDNDFIRLDETIAITVADIRRAASVFAALSPEAPARVGVVMAATDVPMWADGIVTDGENVAMAQKAEADHGGHYWAFDGGNGGLDWEPTHFISLNALTPRHEAPAEGAGERFTEGATLPDGAISGTDDGQTVWLESSTGGAHRLGIWGGLSLRFEEADGSSVVRDYEDVNIRARSSAPEAREGEAVAWRCSRDHASDGNGQWFYYDGPPRPSPLARNVQPLYTHPAAPSADKLRIAMDAFDAITDLSTALRNGGPDSSDLQDLSDNLNTAVDLADQALAALKAEGR